MGGPLELNRWTVSFSLEGGGTADVGFGGDGMNPAVRGSLGAGGGLRIGLQRPLSADAHGVFFGVGGSLSSGVYRTYEPGIMFRQDLRFHFLLNDRQADISAGIFGFHWAGDDGSVRGGGGITAGARGFFTPLLTHPTARFGLGADVILGAQHGVPPYGWNIFLGAQAVMTVQFGG